MQLRGRQALVTGATAGIGEATAHALAAAGADVILNGRREDRLHEVAKAVAEHGTAVSSARFDVADRAAVDAAFQARPGMADVDILVNNAGLARGVDPMHVAAVDDWEEMIRTNVLGLLYMTRPVAAKMAARGDGHIVNLGSVAGRWMYPGGGVYGSTKAAVASLTEGLRYDLLGKGVRVTNIEPGLVETEFSMVRFRGDEARAKKVYQGFQPLRPADVADTIVWCVARPAHVNVQELVLYPTAQAGVRDVARG